MNNRIISIFKYLLGWPFSILALFFILKLIIPQIPVLLNNIKSLNLVILLGGVFSFLLFYFIRSYIWYRLINHYKNSISFKQSSYFWALSELKRYIPGSIIALLSRTVLFSKLGIAKKEVGKLLIVEAGIFVLGASVISLLALPFVANYFFSWLNVTYQLFISYAVLLLVLVYTFNRKFSKILPDFTSSENVFLIFLSCCAVLFFGVGNYFVINSFMALPINLFFQLSGFFTLSILIGYLSILTPAGFGVREGIVIVGLSKIPAVTLSAFAALFSRIVLVLSELIFVGLVYFWHKTKNKKILAWEDWIGKHKQEVILTFLFVAFVLYFTVTSFARYDNFYAGRFDLGNMAQTVWNTTKGRIFEFTNPNGTSMISRLAFHADFLLILLAPFYAIFPNPKTLLLIQAVVVGAGCIFIYLIAKDKLSNKNLALVFSFAYLINPSIQRATLYDFHPVTLATTFLLGTYYFYSKRKYILFFIFALLAGVSKEQIWLIIGLFGGLIFFKQKKRALGAAIFFSCLGIFYYLVSVAIPNAYGASHFALAYYSDFGDSPLTIIKTLILSPQKVISIVFQKEQIDYLIQLFAPLGFLSFLSPFYLFLAGPDLLINLLSNNSQFHQIYYQYTAAISPFIFICAILGIKTIRQFIVKNKSIDAYSKSSINLVFTIYIGVVSLYSAYLYGPLPGSKSPNLDMFTKPVKNREFIDEYLTTIPKRLSVASSNNIGSHFSQRQRIYTLPLGIDTADVIVFLLDDSEPPGSLALEKAQLEKMRKDKNYEITVEKDSFVVFRKKKI